MPKLLVINSIGHNPTGTSLEPAAADKLLALAETHGFMILEDDVYADLCPRDIGMRLASLDRQWTGVPMPAVSPRPWRRTCG